MKFLPFVFKHLRKNWVRTTSTVIAMAVCVFLLCTLRSVLAEVDSMLQASAANRLITRHAVSLNFNLPVSHQERIRAVPGVKNVVRTNWFGGSLTAKKEVQNTSAEGGETTADFSKFFNNMAVEMEPFFAVSPEYQVPKDQLEELLKDRQGCAIGRLLAERFNWKIGDRFFLESFIPPYRKSSGPFEFVVRAIVDADLAKNPGTDLSSMYFHWDYFNESLGGRMNVGTFMVEIADSSKAGPMSKEINALFENSDAATQTETEQAFKAGFISMAGNLALLLNGIGLAVAFTILLVTANTMSMAVRERRTEIGVLKTLGFSSGHVMGFIAGEALLLGVLGGALGVLGSQGLLTVLMKVPATSQLLAGIGLSTLSLKPAVAATGFAVAVVLGLLAGFVPALGAYRARITDILRTV